MQKKSKNSTTHPNTGSNPPPGPTEASLAGNHSALLARACLASTRALDSGQLAIIVGAWKKRKWGEGRVVDQFEKYIPSAAKAATDFAALTARLKPLPFKANSN
jgi:hypothetical protein